MTHYPKANRFPTCATQIAKLNIRRKWARDPETPAEFLARLSYDDDFLVRWEVTRNPSTPLLTLAKLATDKDPAVVLSVAENPRTLPDVLREISRDPRWASVLTDLILGALYFNPNTPPDVEITEIAETIPGVPGDRAYIHKTYHLGACNK